MKKRGIVFIFVLSIFLCTHFVFAQTLVKPFESWADSEYSEGYSVLQTYDDNVNTAWFTDYNYGFPADIYLQFETNTVLKGLQIMTYVSYAPMTFDIYVSDDNEVWKQVLASGKLSKTNDYQVLSFNDTKARFVKLSQTENNVKYYGGAIRELRGVMGTLSTNSSSSSGSGSGGGSSTGGGSSGGGSSSSNTSVIFCSVDSDCPTERSEPYCSADGTQVCSSVGHYSCINKQCISTGGGVGCLYCDYGCKNDACNSASSNLTCTHLVDQVYVNNIFSIGEKMLVGTVPVFIDDVYGSAILINVNGTLETVNLGDTEKVNGIRVRVDSIEGYNSDAPQRAEVSLCFDDTVVVFENSCFEWDNGKDYFRSSYLEFNGNYVDNDRCLYISNSETYYQTEQCSGDQCGIKEFYCALDNSSYDFEIRPCKNGCYYGECVAEYSPRELESCDSLITFIENPRDFELLDKDASWANNFEFLRSWNYSSFIYLNNQEYDFDYYSTAFYSSSQNNYDGTYYYNVYRFEDSIEEADLQNFFGNLLDYQVCDVLNIDTNVYYVCDGSFWNFDEIQDYPNSKSGSIYWIHENTLFEVRVYYYWFDYRNYDGDYERYLLEDIRREVSEVENKQLDSLSFLADIKDNQPKFFNPVDFYYSMPWGMERLFTDDIVLCPSTLNEQSNSCNPSWQCSLEPLVCPPHGEQTRVCTDSNGCFEKRETTEYCNPGICSGCNIPRWFQYNGLAGNDRYLDTICMPYGARFGVNNGWTTEDVFKTKTDQERLYVSDSRNNDVILTVFSNDEATLVLFDGESNETLNLVEGEKYDLSSLDFFEDSYLTFVLYVDDVYYDSANVNESYIDVTIYIEVLGSVQRPQTLNMYCDYDGQLKVQKTKLVSGDWATCQNNFECDSNLCSGGSCIEINDLISQASGLKKLGVQILCRFADLFGTQDYDSCLLENLGSEIVSSTVEP